MPYLYRAYCLPSGLRHVIIIHNSWQNTTKSRNRRPRHYVTFILTTIVGRRPNCLLGTAASESEQLRMLHSQRFCPHAMRVTVWLTTSSVSQGTHQRTMERFGHGLTEISSYLPTLKSKEIETIFSALQPLFIFSTQPALCVVFQGGIAS